MMRTSCCSLFACIVMDRKLFTFLQFRLHCGCWYAILPQYLVRLLYQHLHPRGQLGRNLQPYTGRFHCFLAVESCRTGIRQYLKLEPEQ
jgi:hypothetical protein